MRNLLVTVLTMTWPTLAAAECSLAPFNETWTSQGSAIVQASADGDGCELRVAMDKNSDAAAAGVVHFRRRERTAPLRFRFRIDPLLHGGLGAGQSVTLAMGVARSAPAAGLPSPLLFRIGAFKPVQPSPKGIAISAACTRSPDGVCSVGHQYLPQFPQYTHQVAIELHIGAGKAGRLRYWIHSDFSQPSTGELSDLDNAGWGGIERITLGLASAGSSLRHVSAQYPMRFDRILLDDDQLAWHDFEPGASEACQIEPTIVPLPSPTPTLLTGTTCGGGRALTVLASGSTWAPASERIHALDIAAGDTPSGQPVSIVIQSPVWQGMAMFLCERQCAPTNRCLAAAHGSDAVPGTLQTLLTPGRYHLVVKSLWSSGTCGDYSVQIDAPPQP